MQEKWRFAHRFSRFVPLFQRGGADVHNFQDTYGHLPTGGRDGDHRVSSLTACCRSWTRHGWNWSYWILPFIEQNTVFDLGTDAEDPNPPTTSASNSNPTEDPVARSAISTFYCPTRRDPRPHGSLGFYLNDYAGNAGERGPGGIRDSASRGYRGVVMITDGNRRQRIERIRDGASNTIMVGEKALHPESHGTDGGDNERWNNSGWDEDCVRFGAGRLSNGTEYGIPPIPDDDASHSVGGSWTTVTDPGGRTFGRWHIFFGSPHRGVTNFCLADGAVRPISFDVDSEVFRRLSVTNTGEPVEVP